LAAGYGSDTTHQARGVYGRRLANGLELMASASEFGSDGKRRLYYPEFDDPATNFGVAENADGERAERYFAQIAYGDFGLRLGYGSRDKQIPTASFSTLFAAPGTESTDSFAWADASYQRELGNDWSLELRSYWDRNYYHAHFIYDAALAPPAVPYTNDDRSDSQRVGSGVTVSGAYGARNRLSAGIDLLHSYRIDQRNRDLDPTVVYLDSREHATDWGFYLQDAVTISNGLTLLVGARYDSYELSDDRVNPRVALVWQAAEATVLKLLYGTAFRAPDGYELFYSSPLIQNAPAKLAAETIETTELVLEQQLGESLRFTGSLYYSQIKDLIAIETDPLDGLLVVANREGRKSFGLENTLEGNWTGGWKARASWAMQRTEDSRDGSRLPNSPTHQVKLNLIAPLLGERFFAATELQYTSDRVTIYGTRAGNAFLTNLTLDAPDLAAGFSLQAGVRNLFNERYFDPGSEEHVQARIEQNGRTLFITTRVAF
ncbi:MAG: TonB-dependent receptor, partial [Myxococcales bacterium]|nr:TonB-dependent receptor [Myxococcales bacterium]